MTWQEGSVDRSGEHIELRYSDASHAGNDQWTPVALIGRPTGLVFPVQWLAEPDVPREVIAKVRHELDFYLVEKHEPNPWGYAVYHCGTVANVYSGIHWSYFPSPGAQRSQGQL